MLLATVSVFISILYFSRQIFSYRYEPEYYENYYYNSQWNVPLSTRGISDGELYKFVGYRLTEGENPFYLNYEVPPFAKHLFGIAEKTIGNPYWVSLGFYVISAVGIYFLAFEIMGGVTQALFATLLFVSTPFVGTQIKETMLDLPLTCLFLLNALFFTRYFKRRKLIDLILAGIFLGLATGTKIGVYTPLALLFGLIVSLVSSKKIFHPIIYGTSTLAGYVFSFISYFSRHPNPIPWLKLHEKPINFYLGTAGDGVDYLMQWRGIFLNSYKGFWEGSGTGGLGDWSLILPIGAILMIDIFIQSFRKKDFSLIYLTLVCLAILITNTFIPFWPRYLMPIVPLFIIFIVYYFRKSVTIILLLILINLAILYPTITENKLSGHTDAVARFISTRAYRELYRSIDSNTRSEIEEAKFQKELEEFFTKMRIKEIQTTIVDLSDKVPPYHASLCLDYTSDYGNLENCKKVLFVIENNQWKTVWDWGFLWPSYSPDKELVFTRISTKPVVPEKKAVYVIPRLMYDWGKYTNVLSELTDLSTKEIDARLRRTIPDDFPRFVGYLDPNLTEEAINKNLLPGISTITEPATYPSEITVK